MANTSARMLRLLSLLQTHRYWPGSELAGRLEVSARTLRRDVDRLRELGYPVDASRGVAGGYQLQAGAAVPPLLLDDDEAVAIAIGLRTAAAGAVAGFEEISVRALAKVIQLLPPRLRRRIDALRSVTTPGVLGGGPVLDPAVLTTIALACRGEERLRFEYAPREREAAARLVEPHHLVPLGRRWYLIAWDLDRADWRSFRVDRLSGPSLTGARFRPREIPGGDPVAWVRSRIAAVSTRYEVSVVLETSEERVKGIVGHWATVEPLSPPDPDPVVAAVADPAAAAERGVTQRRHVEPGFARSGAGQSGSDSTAAPAVDSGRRVSASGGPASASGGLAPASGRQAPEAAPAPDRPVPDAAAPGHPGPAPTPAGPAPTPAGPAPTPAGPAPAPDRPALEAGGPAGPRTPAGTRQACRMRMSVDDLGWPVMVLGVLGVPFTIESPPELREHVRAAGETLLRGVA